MGKLEDTEIALRYNYHKPSTQGLALMRETRQMFKALARHINDTAEPSRETSLALTQLEQAHFYFNSAVARRGESHDGMHIEATD